MTAITETTCIIFAERRWCDHVCTNVPSHKKCNVQTYLALPLTMPSSEFIVLQSVHYSSIIRYYRFQPKRLMSYLVVYTGYGAILAASLRCSPVSAIFAWADSFNNLQINYQYEKKKKELLVTFDISWIRKYWNCWHSMVIGIRNIFRSDSKRTYDVF